MPALIIGDLHFDSKTRGMMEAQKQAVLKIATDHKDECDQVIFLGDLMMHRHPKPSVMLALKDLMNHLTEKLGYEVHILRGNHDSETKADDGVTALSLLENDLVNVYTQTTTNQQHRWYFIPHYEDEERIKQDLRDAPRGYYVFGHFGYKGVLNSAGDADFNLRLSDFSNPTILGHIHKATKEGLVTVLGTPYTTNFGESHKDCFYGILRNQDLEVFSCEYGPKHLSLDYDSVQDNLEWLNSDSEPWDFTLLRVNISTIDEDQDSLAKLKDSLEVAYLDVKYKPLLDEKEEFITDDRIVTNILDGDLLDHYINSSNTSINKDSLLEGLNLVYENQRSRDK